MVFPQRFRSYISCFSCCRHLIAAFDLSSICYNVVLLIRRIVAMLYLYEAIQIDKKDSISLRY